MELNRRDFLKLSGVGVGGGVIAKLGVLKPPELLEDRQYAPRAIVKQATTVCCYCSVGCGAIVTTYDDGTISVEGDPSHPINKGDLCPKGLAMAQIHQVDGKLNPYRLTRPIYRAPNSSKWEEKTWDWTIDALARRVKGTRDSTYNLSARRTDALASLGGGELDNEECYLLSKMNRGLGVVYQEHCARL